MGSLAQEDETGLVAASKRLAEDEDTGEGDVRGAKRAREDDAPVSAEDESDRGFFCRLLRDAGCEVQDAADGGKDRGVQSRHDLNGGAKGETACSPFFTSAAASAASVRKVCPWIPLH